MIGTPSSQIERRLYSLEKHLKQENPVLLKVVQSFRDLDWVAYRTGLLNRTESYATLVPWWPMISILGTFSSGKSTFINSFLEQKLQRTGNQAVDDKFTVLCFSSENGGHTLPGLALDADPRFPFYQMSDAIDHVVKGEGRRIDAYLQLKTCATEKLRGKILIDSPGFDADAQRTATLRITDHIIDLSDLVLIFFDARHPESGAMRDTLQHLVTDTIHRHDSNKFIYVLNQIDCTARENNLEDVVAAWQRALAQCGLTAGRFYQIYNDDAASPIEDPNVRSRFQTRRDEDMADILLRIQRVEVERAYRIIGVLEHTAHLIENRLMPKLQEALIKWRKRVLIVDGVIFGAAGVAALIAYFSGQLSWGRPVIEGLVFDQGWPAFFAGFTWGGHFLSWMMILLFFAGVSYVHFQVRKWIGRFVARAMEQQMQDQDLLKIFRRAFEFNTRRIRSIFCVTPSGWGSRTKNRIAKVLKEIDIYVQSLNDQFTNPSGKPGIANPKTGMELPFK